MESMTAWSRAVGRRSDLQGSLLLTNAGLLLIGAWITLGFAPSAVGTASAEVVRHPLALEAYDEACKQGDPVACNNLGVCYQSGYGTERDDERALAIFERACSAGSADACNNQAALLERRGQSTREGAAPQELYRRACAGGAGIGCSNLGALYFKGQGVPRAPDHARALFERACQLGSVVGCENRAALVAPGRANASGARSPGGGFEG